MTAPRATPEDAAIGERIASRRKELGMLQTHLGDAIGVTYQQVHKYEKGINRIPGTRLHAIARALKVELGVLLDGADPDEDDEPLPAELHREMLEFAKSYRCLSQHERDAIRALARALAKAAHR